MANISDALREIDQFERLAKRDEWVNRFHPLVKLVLGVFYIAVVVSFDKYSISGLLAMVVYPFFMFNAADLSFKDALHRLRIVLPIVMVVGIFNPIFDREVAVVIGNVPITGGILSMITIMIKGVLTVLGAYILIATTSIEEICYAFQCLHFPKSIIVVILLIYRYISLFLTESAKITTAYHLRAPRQKGINYKAWGPLVGQMLLRSLDRAQAVYDSMCLRGFHGEFFLQGRKVAGDNLDERNGQGSTKTETQKENEKGSNVAGATPVEKTRKANKQKHMRERVKNISYLLLWLLVFVIIRYTDIVARIGELFV